MEISAFEDEVCIGESGPCFIAQTPPSALYPSGHGVALAPAALEDWTNDGTVVISNPGNPTSAISSAFIGVDGSLQGDAEFIDIVLTATEDIPATNPAFVTIENILASTSSGAPMGGTVYGSAIVVTANGCDINPTICNDGNPCTTDVCDSVTGTCFYSFSAGG